MSFQIEAIHLYNGDGEVRVLDFNLGAVNVITGASKTGKTALIEIVEYCLGSSRCRVPAGVIRDTVRWYGLVLVAGETRIVAARAAPDEGMRSSEEVYLEIAPDETPIPSEHLISNTNTEGLKAYLTGVVGIPDNLFEPPDGQTRSAFAVQLRHALFLTFQRQDEIASKNLLFHRQGEPFIPQAIKDSLPFFLGAIGDDRLLKQRQLRRLRRRLALLERQQREAIQIQQGALTRGAAILSEAREVGLSTAASSQISDRGLMDELRRVAEWSDSSVSMPENTETELERLEDERRQLLADLLRLSREIAVLDEFLGDQASFADEIADQAARLSSLEVLPEQGEEQQAVCPVCDSTIEEDEEVAITLSNVLDDLRGRLSSVTRDRPHVTDYQAELEQRREELETSLRSNQRQISSVLKENERLQHLKELSARRAHVSGRASLYVESVAYDDQPETLEDEIASVREEVSELERGFDEDAIEEVLQSQLNRLGIRMTQWAVELQLEHASSPLRFDLRRLTIVADTDSGPVSLEEMGSGENWVGYHLIAHLVLHEWFVRRNRPVPRFLFLDQPTQVYFPPDTAAEGRLEELESESDRAAVARLFRLLFDVVESLSPAFQVIVTDHADLTDEWFQRAVVERWRGGRRLIPDHWT